MQVVIVGCGLGGLACAIQCRREGLSVLILEKAPELSDVGAGIQLPPNASCIMHSFGLMDKLFAAGMVAEGERHLIRWQDGTTIARRPGAEWAKEKFGHAWHLMHRADYQFVLAQEARRLGVEIRLGCDIVAVHVHDAPHVTLADGQTIAGDVIVGADGLHSVVRTAVLGSMLKNPKESGDLAYRVTIPRADLEAEADPFIQALLSGEVNGLWWGENKHVVAYGVRDQQLLNIVLCCPDNLPPKISRQHGDLAEMRALFEDWDPRLQTFLSKVNTALKWKLWTLDELDSWVKGAAALLGDACHPSLPYAASGAAMAVEDGATLGKLLGLQARSDGAGQDSIPEVLKFYETLRKDRATSVVELANSNRSLYHMLDGPEQQHRDHLFHHHDWWDDQRAFPWQYADPKWMLDLYAFDALKAAEEAFEQNRPLTNTAIRSCTKC